MSTDESEEGALAVAAVRSGALGVLFEDMDPGRLVPALRDVAAGGPALPRMLVPAPPEHGAGRRLGALLAFVQRVLDQAVLVGEPHRLGASSRR